MYDLCRLCALEKPHLIPTIGEKNLDLIENISKLLSIHVRQLPNIVLVLYCCIKFIVIIVDTRKG